MKIPVKKRILLLICFTLPLAAGISQAVHPDDIVFRRQAVQRMIFDAGQRIPLSGLWPAKTIGLEVMHPAIDTHEHEIDPAIVNGRLLLQTKAPASTVRWVGGCNPFATYDLDIQGFSGSGQAGFLFRDTKGEKRLAAHIISSKSRYTNVACSIQKNSREIEIVDLKLPETLDAEQPIVLRVQMMAIGANIFVEQYERTILVGYIEFSHHFDLRNKSLFRDFEYCLSADLDAEGEVSVNHVVAYLGPGIGQADVRFITYEDGSPFFMENRLWITMSVRGFRGGWPQQGVFSIDPSVFDVKYEGLIVFDRNDGLLRNDIASNIFYDRNAQEWRGFTTGFSAFGDPEGMEKKQILAVHSDRLPLKGFCIMQAEPIGLVGDYEDPHCIWDEDADKWRMLICENRQGYKSVMRESDTWNGDYQIIGGPVKVNSTGTQIQKIGDTRYAIFGSSDRKIYVFSYPDLAPVSTLNIVRPPWNASTRTRIWPNVMPLPEGYPSPYIALTMDRINFPGVEGDNWTYGALYLYHGYLKEGKRNRYEYNKQAE